MQFVFTPGGTAKYSDACAGTAGNAQRARTARSAGSARRAGSARTAEAAGFFIFCERSELRYGVFEADVPKMVVFGRHFLEILGLG
jgi:hypothetical protein